MITEKHRNGGGAPQALARLLTTLSDPTRLRILCVLRDGDRCVCEIQQALRVPQPTISRHLAHLRHAGLVSTRRDGLWVHYQLAPNVPGPLRELIDIVGESVAASPEGHEDRFRLASLPACCASHRPPTSLP